MTFTPKTFEQIKADHLETIKQMLIKHISWDEKKHPIEDLNETKDLVTKLEEPRKSQLSFITNLIQHLDPDFENTTQIIKSTKSAKAKADAKAEELKYHKFLYGAMLTIMAHIESYGSPMNSHLYKRLLLNFKEPLTTSQYEDINDTFNEFVLSTLYTNEGQKKFLNPKHYLLEGVNTKYLSEILIQGYKFISNTSNKVILELPVDGVPLKNSTHYVGKEIVDPSRTQQFGDFEALNDKFKILINLEITDWKVEEISKIADKNRKFQMQFLDTCRLLIKKLDTTDSEKTAILAGLMHLVRGEINKTYKYSALYRDKIDGIFHNTRVQTELSDYLGTSTESFENIEAFLIAAKQFIYSMTIETNCKELKKSIRPDNILSKIEGFDQRLPKLLGLIEDMLCLCREEIVTNAIKAHLEHTKSKAEAGPKPEAPKSSGIMASVKSYLVWGSSSKPKEDDKGKEEEVVPTEAPQGESSHVLN